jgi:hypothetical protein
MGPRTYATIRASGHPSTARPSRFAVHAIPRRHPGASSAVSRVGGMPVAVAGKQVDVWHLK